MIEKFLIRFCASEVRVMVTRMHERPEDFDYGSRWRDLAEARSGLTWAERKVLDKEWAKFKKNKVRRELLGLITHEVINPTPKKEVGTWFLGTAGLRQHLNQHQRMMSDYIDPRAMYGQNDIHPQRLHP